MVLYQCNVYIVYEFPAFQFFMIPTHLKDPALKISPSLYTVCILLRISLAFLVFFVMFPYKNTFILFFALSIVAFFLYKQSINPRSWKNYVRTIILYSAIAVLSYLRPPRWEQYVGLLILVDVAMGQQTWYIAKTYL